MALIMLRVTCSIFFIFLLFASVGCKKEPIATFEPNLVFAHNIEIDSGYAMAPALAETATALDEMFGTPDVPKVPDFISGSDELKSLFSLEGLQRASGPADEKGRGLYRVHCAFCHGVVGNGRGASAALLPTYPRDYRLGKFKFKVTSLSSKPTRADILKTIKNGISGTSMKTIPDLTDEDHEALTDYVIYLSVRGELERELLLEGGDLDFEATGEDEEHLYAPGSQDFDEQKEYVIELGEEIAGRWIRAEDDTKTVPAPPEGLLVPETVEEVLAAVESGEPTALVESIEKGREIFASEAASCAKCHGAKGYGDGQTQDYDDWTKDWTKRWGLDPEDEKELIPLIARGALPPKKIFPRDFRQGEFRGGSSPEALYRRIAFGIGGTPMPAAAVPPDDIWHLVNFVRSLRTLDPATEEAATESGETVSNGGETSGQ